MIQLEDLRSKKPKEIDPRLIDLSGRMVGSVEVLGLRGRRKRPCGVYAYEWECRCKCGQLFSVDGTCIKRGNMISCGCMIGAQSVKHGMARTGGAGCRHNEHWAYKLWLGIKQRCYNEHSSCFQDYGGRGIKMCDAWKESAEQFYLDMGDRPSLKHTIDRIDNDGDYCPENCRWATRAEQNENTRQTRLLSFDGKTMSIGKWARRIGIKRKTITSRLDRLGWSVERALSTPVLPMARN